MAETTEVFSWRSILEWGDISILDADLAAFVGLYGMTQPLHPSGVVKYQGCLSMVVISRFLDIRVLFPIKDQHSIPIAWFRTAGERSRWRSCQLHQPVPICIISHIWGLASAVRLRSRWSLPKLTYVPLFLLSTYRHLDEYLENLRSRRWFNPLYKFRGNWPVRWLHDGWFWSLSRAASSVGRKASFLFFLCFFLIISPWSTPLWLSWSGISPLISLCIRKQVIRASWRLISQYNDTWQQVWSPRKQQRCLDLPQKSPPCTHVAMSAYAAVGN